MRRVSPAAPLAACGASGGAGLGQRPVEIRRQPGFGALFLVERRFQRPLEIFCDQGVKDVARVEIVAAAEEMEPYTNQLKGTYEELNYYDFSTA